jgi:hypothetical protein
MLFPAVSGSPDREQHFIQTIELFLKKHIKRGGHESDKPLFVPPLYVLYCLNFVSYDCLLKIRLVERAHRIDYDFFFYAEHHAYFR